MSNVRIIPGPPASKVSKAQAEAGLTSDADFPKGADYALDVVEGRWVAAISTQSGPPFGNEEAEEGPPGPPSDGPPSDSGGEGPPSPDSDEGGEEKPKGDKKEKGGGDAKLLHILETIAVALGIDITGGDSSMVPGMDGPPGPGGPPGMDGPPDAGMGGPPPGPPGDDKQHIVHERALKPGDVPPGGTPLGAPAFASVRDDHPWKGVASAKKSFDVEQEIGDSPLAEAANELRSLASEIPGLKVKQLVAETTSNGTRIARAHISR